MRIKGNDVSVFVYTKVKRLRNMNQDLQKVSRCLAMLVATLPSSLSKLIFYNSEA